MKKPDDFQIIGHRGVPCDAPENTLVGFRRALELELTHIEFDLRLTSDGHVILMHDSTVDRTTDGKGEVANLSLQEIKTLDCGAWFDPTRFKGETVPTLREVFALLADTDLHLVLEIKETIRPQFISRQIIHLIKEFGLVKRSSITSFHWNPLSQVKECQPDISIQALVIFEDHSFSYDDSVEPIRYRNVEELLQDSRVSGTDVICPHASAVNEDMVQLLHERGFQVRVWGAQTNCEKEIGNMLKSGIDGMTADHPEFVRKIYQQWLQD